MLAYLGLSTIWDGSPRTLKFEIDIWDNKSWGLHNIERHRGQCEVAVMGDGSRMNRCEDQFFEHYFIPKGEYKMQSLYLRSENAGFQIDHTARTVVGGPCGCTWEPIRALPDDSTCSRTAEFRLGQSKHAGSGRIAGQAVVSYQGVDEDGIFTEVSLAPALACEVMEVIRTWPGTLGIPGAKWHYLVTSYKPGEPDPTLFRPPAGYIVVTRNP